MAKVEATSVLEMLHKVISRFQASDMDKGLTDLATIKTLLDYLSDIMTLEKGAVCDEAKTFMRSISLSMLACVVADSPNTEEEKNSALSCINLLRKYL